MAMILTHDEYLTLVDDAKRYRRQSDRLREALSQLITHAEIKECPHDETYRGGAIWEICSQCGAKWADDEGGRPEHREPEAIAKARAALAEVEGGA